MHPKHKVGLTIEKNAQGDEDQGIIRFPGGQVIIDGQTLRNGRKYDIESMVLEEYAGQVTADHWDALDMIVGKVINCRKEGDAVKIDGIQFATNSPSGRLAHDLMAEGFLTDMSVETYGPWPDESDDTYYKAKLIGLSVVVVGNSKSARVKKLVRNSLAKAKEDGLDTTAVEAALEVDEPSPEPKPAAAPVKQAAAEPIKQETLSMFVTKKNGRDFAIKVTYKNAAGETVSTELAPGASVDVSEDQGDAVETQINQATAPAPDQTENIKSAVATAVKDAVEEATKPLNEKVATLENAFDDQAKEPEFFKTGNSRSAGTTATKLEDMTANERTTLQLQSVAGAVLGRSLSAMKALEAINQFNLDKLKEAGKVENSMTLTDFGNFVVGPENLPGISDRLSNYTPLLSKFKFQETLSLNTAWLEQDGEIEMEDVDMEDHGDNENLKPISEYETNGRSATLKEFAAVTPVDASLIRFSAADIMASLNKNYNNAYDKALAKSVIGRLEKTVEANGHSVQFNYAAGPVDALIALLNAISTIADDVSEGTIALMTEATRLQLLGFQLRAGVGVDSAWSNVFTNGDQPRFFGRPYEVVPSNLLPRLNSAGTKSWTFEGTSVTVNHGILFADPNEFMGRVSGGLSYNVSSEASYEQGGVTKSAFQRDQLVFRGYGYRKSAVLNTESVAGVLSPGIS